MFHVACAIQAPQRLRVRYTIQVHQTLTATVKTIDRMSNCKNLCVCANAERIDTIKMTIRGDIFLRKSHENRKPRNSNSSTAEKNKLLVIRMISCEKPGYSGRPYSIQASPKPKIRPSGMPSKPILIASRTWTPRKKIRSRRCLIKSIASNKRKACIIC